MGLDGQPLRVTRHVTGPSRLDWRECEHGEYVADPTGFSRCSGRYMHCGRCGGVARKFRKGYVCGCR